CSFLLPPSAPPPHSHSFPTRRSSDLAIQRLPVPVIARVQGIATAAGCQLVAMCDLAVASSSARFAVSGVNVGLFCSTPGVALSRSEEHTSELQSRFDLVCRLLLEKKK